MPLKAQEVVNACIILMFDLLKEFKYALSPHKYCPPYFLLYHAKFD